MGILHFHARTLLFLSRDAALRARADADRPNALTSDSIPAIVLAAAATEGFVNEFADLVLEQLPSHAEAMLPPIIEGARVIKELEQNRRPVRDKYFEAAKAFGTQPFDRGAPLFQEFDRLHDLRNAIMHARPALDDGHVGTRQMEILAKRGLAISADIFNGSWFDRVMSPNVAKWAHDSARNIMRAFFDRVPVRPHYDPFESYRELLAKHPECW